MARDVVLADATSAKEHCNTVEAELKALSEEQADQARRLQERVEELKAREAALAVRDAELARAAKDQAAERDRLDKMKKEVDRD